MLKLFCLLAFITIVAVAQEDDVDKEAIKTLHHRYFLTEAHRDIAGVVVHLSMDIARAPRLSEDEKFELTDVLSKAYGKLDDAQWHAAKIFVELEKKVNPEVDEYIRAVNMMD